MKNISNFHTHTQLCHHAIGMPQDYAKQAEIEGCSALGFSDHCPYPDTPTDNWSNVRMTIPQIELYKTEIQKVKESVSFPVFWGFECEYDRTFLSWYRDELLGHFGAQYLVLGSHWLTKGNSRIYCPELTDPKDISTYIDQTIEGMQTGLFAFLAHPDLFMKGYKEWDAQSKAWLKALLDAAIDLNLPIEINGLGMSREPIQTTHGLRYQYPYREFWETVAQTSVPVICNSDAHDPQDVIFNAQKARNFAARLGIEPIDFPEFTQLP